MTTIKKKRTFQKALFENNSNRILTSIDIAILLLSIYYPKGKKLFRKDICSPMFTAALY